MWDPANRRTLILASNSPRRRELLQVFGRNHQTLAASIDETPRPNESPEAYVRRLSRQKAEAVAHRLSPAGGATIVAADTAVVYRGRVLGKPATRDEARDMLRQLRGHTHEVMTGLTVLDSEAGRREIDVARSNVWMRHYSDDEIERYVAGGDPMDKAGAYAIQHPTFKPVERVEGCPANVVGLPLCHLAPMLRRAGIEPGEGMPDACRAPHRGACAVFQSLYNGG